MLRSTTGMGPSMEIAAEGLSASSNGAGGIVPSQSARIEVIGVGGGGLLGSLITALVGAIVLLAIIGAIKKS